MMAHAAADAGQRIALHVHRHGLLELPRGHQSEIARRVDPGRTGVIAGSLDQALALTSRTVLVEDVGLVLVAEVLERRQHWVGSSLAEPTRLRRISYAVFCLKKKKDRYALMAPSATSSHNTA